MYILADSRIAQDSRDLLVRIMSSPLQVWNSELASVAQSYAETCMFGPNPDRAEQAESFDTVGENRAFGPTNNYTQLIERGWFIQRSNFDFDTNMCLSPGACDEYTQVCL